MALADAVAQYRTATEEFESAAAGVSPETIDRHPDGEWSARQVIHHLADAEAHAYVRLRILLADPEGSPIRFFDEAAWASNETLGYRELGVENAVAVIAASRRANADVLDRLSEADIERWGEHSVTGRYTLAQWLEVYTRHARDHATQLSAAAA